MCGRAGWLAAQQRCWVSMGQLPAAPSTTAAGPGGSNRSCAAERTQHHKVDVGRHEAAGHAGARLPGSDHVILAQAVGALGRGGGADGDGRRGGGRLARAGRQADRLLGGRRLAAGGLAALARSIASCTRNAQKVAIVSNPAQLRARSVRAGGFAIGKVVSSALADRTAARGIPGLLANRPAKTPGLLAFLALAGGAIAAMLGAGRVDFGRG